MKYPSTLHKLIERSKKRRVLLRQYKFEALKEIITLALDKTSYSMNDNRDTYAVDKKRERLYRKIMQKLNLNSAASGYAQDRIKSLKTIAKERMEVSPASSNGDDDLDNSIYNYERNMREEEEENKKINERIVEMKPSENSEKLFPDLNPEKAQKLL